MSVSASRCYTKNAASTKRVPGEPNDSMCQRNMTDATVPATERMLLTTQRPKRFWIFDFRFSIEGTATTRRPDDPTTRRPYSCYRLKLDWYQSRNASFFGCTRTVTLG